MSNLVYNLTIDPTYLCDSLGEVLPVCVVVPTDHLQALSLLTHRETSTIILICLVLVTGCLTFFSFPKLTRLIFVMLKFVKSDFKKKTRKKTTQISNLHVKLKLCL